MLWVLMFVIYNGEFFASTLHTSPLVLTSPLDYWLHYKCYVNFLGNNDKCGGNVDFPDSFNSSLVASVGWEPTDIGR